MRRLLDQFRPGKTIYLPGATGEILSLARALAQEPGRMKGVTVLSCLLPGMNRFDYAALDEGGAVTTFLLPPALRGSFEAGRVRLLPLNYSAIAAYLRDEARIDVAVAHLAPPDGDGACSFGISSDFSPIAWRSASCRIAFINPLMPPMRRGPRVALSEADLVVECESPLVEVDRAASCPAEVMRIAQSAAAMIPDGAAIQLGLGGAPGEVCGRLTGHRGLRLRSGMAPQGAQALAAAGALAEPGEHRVGIAAGSADFYRYLGESNLVGFGDTHLTHDGAALGALDGFHAVNSALEIDLLGQVNVEWRNGRLASGVGGAADFARAGVASRGGRSIILMLSTARGGEVSRVVPRLTAPSVSLARGDVDTVITEHGVAELAHRSLDERAQALIAVAGEAARDSWRAWREMRATL